jgi:hypothetical protein
VGAAVRGRHQLVGWHLVPGQVERERLDGSGLGQGPLVGQLVEPGAVVGKFLGRGQVVPRPMV